MKLLSHVRVMRNQCYGIISNKKTVIVATLVFTVIVLSLYEIRSILHCNRKHFSKMVLTKDGRYIPKVDLSLTEPSFRNLSSCLVQNEEINCLDVHTRGNSLLRQIQLKITRMLVIFDLICRKHNIKYWLHSGTMLGAVRHHGNIPWDNDADVGMLRTDYEKLLKVSNELPSDIFIQNIITDPHFHVNQANTAKLRDRNSCYCLCLRYGCKRHDGLMLDIFVYDVTETENQKFYECHYRKKDWYMQQDLFPLREITFEGHNFYAPNNYDIVLKRHYGNFSKLPPESKRCPSKGYIGHPMYSCDEVRRMKEVDKRRIIQESRISNDWILYYVY